MMPLRLTSPTVGLIPTSPFMFAGEMIEPSVSVPTATAARLAAIAAPEPALEPLVLRSSAYGLRVSPPRPLHPDVERIERMFAHSDRLVLPRITAPASRNLVTIVASRGGFTPTSASDPAVVCMPSAVVMLSLISTGIPCSGPRGPLALRSRSRAAAIVSASGLSSITELIFGPALSIARIRARYVRTSACVVSAPDCIERCRSATFASTTSNAPPVFGL